MELFGRDREIARVDRALDAVRSGHRTALAVVGGAGIGKSALLDAIAERAAPLRVVRGRAAEHEREVPFALAVDAFDAPAAALSRPRLEAVGGALGAVLPAADGGGVPTPGGPAERLRIHRAFASLLDHLARERPVVVLLDDMQWADEASLELLGHLLRRPPAAPHLLAFAARPGARLPESDVIALEPLDRDASFALLGTTEDRDAIADAAGGNPLYLRELAAARGDDALPRTLLAAVQRETAALDPASARLLGGAAVAGDPFDPELAAAAAGTPPDAATLDALVTRDLVRPSAPGRAFAFRHPIVRRAVYDALAPAWRLEAHERAADALDARGVEPAARAHHLERCARVGDRAAVAVLRAAAERATTSAPATAARWYAGALRLVGDDPAARAAVLAPIGFALADAGRFEAARAALLGAQATAPSPALAIAAAQMETERGLFAEARRRLLAVLASTPPEGQAAVAFELAVVAYREGRADELDVWAERSLSAVGNDPVLDAGALALGALGAVWRHDSERAAGLLDHAAAALDECADEALAGRPIAALLIAMAQLLSERYAAADECASRALAIMDRSGQGRLAVPLRLTRTMARLQRGALDAALDDAATVEELARLQGEPRNLHCVLWIAALVHRECGERREMERLATECAALTTTLTPDKRMRVGHVTLAVIGDDPTQAIQTIVAGGGEDVQLADPGWSAWLLLGLVRAALATGDHARAEHWARIAEGRGFVVGRARARIAAGELLLARGDARSAAAEAERAATAAERAGALLDSLDARVLSARALAAAGDPDAAKASLQRVATDAGRAHAFRLRDDAARELRALGTNLGSAARRAAGGELTERELAIAELVGDGRTNRQVAAVLYLSEKTVANTLTRVYAKLGVRSRTELARVIA